MPELPEIEAYLHALEPRIVGQRLRRVRLQSFSVLKTYDPRIDHLVDVLVVGVSRLGKRFVIGLDGSLSLVIHLMVAGRFKWLEPDAAIPKRSGLAAIDFAHGTPLTTQSFLPLTTRHYPLDFPPPSWSSAIRHGPPLGDSFGAAGWGASAEGTGHPQTQGGLPVVQTQRRRRTHP